VVNREDAKAACGERSEVGTFGNVVDQNDGGCRIAAQNVSGRGALKVAAKAGVSLFAVRDQVSPRGSSLA
jgi:hypothetical protein